MPAPPSRRPLWRQLVFTTWRSLRGVVRLEDTPHRIAMGSACGIFSSVMPILGQTVVGAVLARMLGGNVIASLPWSWISNPLTTLPLLYGCYALGAALLPGYSLMSTEDLGRLWDQARVAGSWWSAMTGVLGGILVPLWIGSLLVGALMGLPGYLLIRRGVAAVQRRRAERHAGWRPRTDTPA